MGLVGHMERMHVDHVMKKVFVSESEGGRRHGRSELVDGYGK